MVDKVECCSICASVGKASKLKIYQINLKEAVKLCEDEACNYPIGLDKLIKRNLKDIPIPPKRKNVHRQSSLHPPIFSANQNNYLPRPQPLVMSSKAPVNIIRPQPVAAFPQPSCFIPPSQSIKMFDGYSGSSANFKSPSPGLVPVTPVQTNTDIIPSSNVLSPTHHSLLFKETAKGIHPPHATSSQSQNPFIYPDSEINFIDTSEVTEVIDIHFSTDGTTAFHGVTPRSHPAVMSTTSSHTLDNCALAKASSPDLASSNSQTAATSPINKTLMYSESHSMCSSPFIPVRSNIGKTEMTKISPEKQKGIKPMVSNNATDNVISQEIEIETSGSPLLGENTTYFVIEGTGKRRGRKPKPKEEKPNKDEKGETKSNVIEAEKSIKKPRNIEEKTPTLDIYKYFPQWQNEEALCWLDVVLCLFAHSKAVKKLKFENESVDLSHTILVMLFTAYQQACQLVNKYREKAMKDVNSDGKCSRTRSGRLFSDPEESDSDTTTDSPSGEMMKELCKISLNPNSIKTGAGLSCSKDFMSMLSSDDQENYKNAFTVLRVIRETIWKKMQPRLQCVKGKNDSPVLAIPLMVKDSVYCERKFVVEYDFIFRCKVCGYQQTDRYKRVLPTFPSTGPNFTMRDPSFLRSCFKCNAENQRRVMKINRLPDAMMLHFAEGLPHNNFKKLQFSQHGLKYCVTGFVQYRNDPDHFVTWIHRVKDNKWMEFDDLKSPICRFESRQPDVDPKQIHIVMWESFKQSEIHGENSSHKALLKKVKMVAESNIVSKSQSVVTDSSGKKASNSILSTHVKTLNIDPILDMQVKTESIMTSGLSVDKMKTSKNHELREEPSNTTDTGLTCPIQSNYHENNSEGAQKSDSYENLSVSKCIAPLNGIEHNDVDRVRTAKWKRKIERKLEKDQPQSRSSRLIHDALKSMSEKSNMIFAQKTEKEYDDKREALAKLWQPTPEVATKIKKVKANHENKTQFQKKQVDNKWKPVDKIKLTEKKCRGKLSQVEEKVDIPVQFKSVGTSKVELPVYSKSVGTQKVELPVHSKSVGTPKVELPVHSKSVGTPKVELPVHSKSVGTPKVELPVHSKSVGTSKVELPVHSKSVGTLKVDLPVHSTSVGTSKVDLPVHSKSVGTSKGGLPVHSKSVGTPSNIETESISKSRKLTDKKHNSLSAKHACVSNIPSNNNLGQRRNGHGEELANNLKNVPINSSKLHTNKAELSSYCLTKYIETCSEPLDNAHSSELTNGLSETVSNSLLDNQDSYSLTNSEVDTNVSDHLQEAKGTVVHVNGSKYKILSAQFLSNKFQRNTPYFSQLKEKFNLMQKIKMDDDKKEISGVANKDILRLRNEIPAFKSSSRCSNVSLSDARKTFSGFRCKTFSSFKSALVSDSKTSSPAPSPTLSTKSEIVARPKRKLSIDNFITVKKLKSQKSTEKPYAINSTGNSERSSPSMNGDTCIQNNESDILQDLYNVLDIPMNSRGNPESLDLSAIENSSCLQDMDDFLEQLL